MAHKFLEDVAISDIAFSTSAPSLNKLFSECAFALEETMADLKTLRSAKAKSITIEADLPEKLLYSFLSELVFLKDSKGLLFKSAKCRVSESKKGWKLRAQLRGEKINRRRHVLRNDVKAVTMHLFKITKTKRGWKATAVLDI
ncbi:MAG: archease [archaeon]